MGESDRKPLTAIEPVDVADLLASMTEKQREAFHATDAALDAAAFVRRLREVKGVDRPTLAKLAGIDEQQLIDIEDARNHENPSVALLAQIAGGVGEELSIGLRSDPGAFEHGYTISDLDEPMAAPEDQSMLAKLVAKLKVALHEHVSDVRPSVRLGKHAVCLADLKQALDVRLERASKSKKPILQINPKHQVIQKLEGLMADESAGSEVVELAFLLLDQARIVQGEPVPDPGAFSRRMSRYLSKNVKAA